MLARGSLLFALASLSLLASPVLSASVYIPNASFEGPYVDMVPPYATSDITDWQKPPAPTGYPADQWANAAGIFVNVPNSPIDNVDGRQMAFMFSSPGYQLYQDLAATFTVGQSYRLTVGIQGGGYGMQLGVPMEIRLYYRDADNNQVPLGAKVATNTNSTGVLSHLTDYVLDIPTVAANNPWAGKNIGVQLVQTAAPDNAGGYWDIDNVRLEALPEPASLALLAGGLGLVTARRRRAQR